MNLPGGEFRGTVGLDREGEKQFPMGVRYGERIDALLGTLKNLGIFTGRKSLVLQAVALK